MAVKLPVEDLVKVGPVVSLVVVALSFTVGILLSIWADRRDADAGRHRDERTEALRAQEK